MRRLSPRRLAMIGLSVASTASLVLAVVATGGSAAARPPGNNGTVKIDRKPFDTHPNNEPHVGCIFQIDFYGYDKGDLDARVRLNLHPPTGRALLYANTIRIGEDAAGGGTDLDAELTVDLSTALAASGATPHPIQGFHVKLTVNAEGSIGADVKHKVFWVRECVAPSPTPSESPSPSPSESPSPSPSESESPTPSESESPLPSGSETPSESGYPMGSQALAAGVIGGGGGEPPAGGAPQELASSIGRDIDTSVVWIAGLGFVLLLGTGGLLRLASRRSAIAA
jgi:hypothetical protein